MSTTNAPQPAEKTGHASTIIRIVVFAVLLLVVAVVLYLILTPSGQVMLGNIEEKGLGNWLFGEGNQQEELSAADELEKNKANVVKENGKIMSVDFSLYPKPSDEALKLISKLTFLSNLNLANAEIRDEQLACLDKNMHHLINLSISGTPITDAGMLHLAGLSSLNTLHANNTKITDKALDTICKLSAIKVLNISYNDITDAGMKKIATMPNLAWLLIDGTKITDAGLEEVLSQASQKKLSKDFLHITISRNMKVSGETIKKLEQAISNMKVDVVNTNSPSSRPPADDQTPAEKLN
jgi:hypothetical protein